MGNKKSLVVIGNGIVGQHFLVSFGVAAKEGYVFMAFYEELRLAYDRGICLHSLPTKQQKT